MDDPCIGHFVRYLQGERNASGHTISSYLVDLEQFVRIQWGAEAKPPYVWSDVDKFSARKFIVHCQKQEAAATTINRKLSSLRSFFKFLNREEHVQQNPFAVIISPKRGKPLPKVLTLQEVARLLEAPRQVAAEALTKEPDAAKCSWLDYAASRDTAILEILYSTGMRVSELAGMNESDIDMLASVVKVRGKGKKERLCLLGKPAVRAIQAALEKRSTLAGVFRRARLHRWTKSCLPAVAVLQALQAGGQAVLSTALQAGRLSLLCRSNASGCESWTASGSPDNTLVAFGLQTSAATWRGASNRRETSWSVNTLGRGLPRLSEMMPANGFCVTCSSRFRNLKNDRRLESFRLTVVATAACFWQCTMNLRAENLSTSDQA